MAALNDDRLGPRKVLFGLIEKVDQQDDGTIRVSGICSTEERDDQGEVVRASAMRDAIPNYMRFGAVREMHSSIAAGRALEIDVGADGITRMVAHIVDPVAVLKIRNRVLQGFSIGGRITSRDPVDRKVITGLDLTEVSVVDRPANPEAVFDCWKSADGGPATSGESGDNAMADGGLGTIADTVAGLALAAALASPEQIWACGDVAHKHAKKDDAAACIAKRSAAPDLTADPPAASPPPGPADTAIAEAEAALARAAAIAKAGGGEDERAKAKVRKSLHDVGHVASLLIELDWLRDSLQIEAAVEGDESPQPARLREIIIELAAFLNALAMEEVGELVAASEPAIEQLGDEFAEDEFIEEPPTAEVIEAVLTRAGSGPVAKRISELLAHANTPEGVIRKAGRRNSGPDQLRLQAMHDMCCELGANCIETENTKNAASGYVVTRDMEPGPLAAATTGLVKRLLQDERTPASASAQLEDAHLALVGACAGLAVELPAEVAEPIARRHSAADQALLDLAHCAADRAVDMVGVSEARKGDIESVKSALIKAGANTPPADPAEQAGATSWTMAVDQLAKRSAEPDPLLGLALDCLGKLADGARSRAMRELLDEAHAHLTKAQAPAGTDDAAATAKLAGLDDNMAKRLAAAEETTAQVVKIMGQQTEMLAKQTEMLAKTNETVEKIAKTPLPAATSELPPGITAVTKGDDGRRGAESPPGLPSREDIQKYLGEMTEEERVVLQIRGAHMHPMKMAVAPR